MVVRYRIGVAAMEMVKCKLESTFPLTDLGMQRPDSGIATRSVPPKGQRREPPQTCWSPPGKDCMPIYGDYVHFGGRRKPWMKPPPGNLSRATRWDSSIHLWYWTLIELNIELGLNFSANDWVSPEDPPLGLRFNWNKK